MIFDEKKIVDARSYAKRRCKATIQKSGKLGFTANAAELMGLEQGARLLVSECNNSDLAVVVLKGTQDERGFKVRKSVVYFTVDMKAFFDQRGIDYRNAEYSVAYDIVMLDETFEGQPVFKLTRRLIKRRGKQEMDSPF